MQITGPTPIYYLPENLWSLFSRPGREITARVIQIEGKLLYLELGGQRFQARLTGNLLPEDFSPGEVIRLKVLNNEGPIVLQVLEHSKTKGEHQLLYLLVSGKRRGIVHDENIKRREWIFLRELLRGFHAKERVIEEGGSIRNVEDLLGRELKSVEIFVEEDRLFIPFMLRDEKSWGYLEIVPSLEGKDRVKVFVLTLFLQYLGFMEAIFSYTERDLEIDLFFAEPHTLGLAKEYLKELKDELFFSEKFVKITLDRRSITPGQIIEKRG